MTTANHALPSYRTLFLTGISIGSILLAVAVTLRTLQHPSLQRIGVDEFHALLYSGVFIVSATLLSLLVGLMARWGREWITFREIAMRHKTNEALLQIALPHPWLPDIILVANDKRK